MGKFEVSSYGNVDVMAVNGRIDSSNAPDLDVALKGLTDQKRYKLVIDLSGINYMSSAGLRALVSALKECKKNNGDIRISQPSERAAEVLSLAGLTSLFKVFDDQVAAVGSYT